MSKARTILHVDMDAFFASVEQLDNPLLKGKPVIVGADPKGGNGRGVVSTCSYEAREYGIHSAMPISIAYQKCPHGVFISGNMKKYGDVSKQIYEIFYQITPDVQGVGIDEAFLDITGTERLFGKPLEVAKLIKKKIRQKIGLTASVGIAPIKMAAKIASDLKKPDGLVEVKPENLLDFLWPLDISKIWGLGKKTEVVMRRHNINTIGDLAKTSKDKLNRLFGAYGLHFWELANGIDEREVRENPSAKSLSAETTFDMDTNDEKQINSALLKLCDKVAFRLRAENLKGKTITLKIRLQGFETYTRALTLPKSTNYSDEIFENVKKLYFDFKKPGKKRLLGVKLSNLIPADTRESLFEEEKDCQREAVHQAMEKIRAKFGKKSISRGI
jgi:DNA polymerase IV